MFIHSIRLGAAVALVLSVQTKIASAGPTAVPTSLEPRFAAIVEPVAPTVLPDLLDLPDPPGPPGPSCCIPCDHVPIRSWPLFTARDVMRGVIESFKTASVV